MRYPLIDWIDARCRTWGHDRRRLRRAQYPPSTAGRLDEPIGYGTPPEPLEGLTGDALYVAVAIRRALEGRSLSLRQHAALYLHYDDRYRRVPAKAKCKELGVSRDTYYHALAQAHRVIDAHWPTDMADREAHTM